MVTGDAEPYRYLVESIRKFPKPNVFEGMIADAGRDELFTAANGGDPAELVVVVCGRPSLAPHRVPTA
jgi:ubiquinone/menaquinone biosynthesis C-methylase UbiE